MRLLHVSDIHFRHPDCTTGLDPEMPFRTALIQDAKELSAEIGAIDKIAVTGDIAYHGLIPEYAAARTWLLDLAKACGCSNDQILVVPGNHDIDWNVIKNSLPLRNAQRAIARSDEDSRERELLAQLSDDETGRALLSSLTNYNAFAAEFNCQVYPKKPLWKQDSDLGDQVTLRVHGLTSTILSGIRIPHGEQDKKGDLYLSRFQTVLNPEEGVVNMILCHHPPDWCLDQDEIEEAIEARSLIHMFGHKHRQRIRREANYLRLSAGAVNPDPKEKLWEPGYNLLELSVLERNKKLYLKIKAHLRRWQSGPPDKFVAKKDNDGRDYFPLELRINGRRKMKVQPAAAGAGSDKTAVGVDPKLEAVMSEPNARNLISRFWRLPSSERRDIALRLKLIETEDLKLPEPERYGRALLRAGELGLLDQVEEEVERMEKRHGR
jgi:predicted phosphodiesterase